ncbi:hypothetical protein GGR58DRAFT_478783 [Xylaria digitata]|nr:hypothetical protein GGR58DRAFT_478783 [Xylaria digitata]
MPSATFNISARHLIPENATIIRACAVGDGEQVRQLLKSRIARPNDVTINNKTPLGVSILAIPHSTNKLTCQRLPSMAGLKKSSSCCF